MAVLSTVINLSRRAMDSLPAVLSRDGRPSLPPSIPSPKYYQDLATGSLLGNLNWEERENRRQLAFVAPITTIR